MVNFTHNYLFLKDEWSYFPWNGADENLRNSSFLWNLKDHSVHRSLQMDPILSQFVSSNAISLLYISILSSHMHLISQMASLLEISQSKLCINLFVSPPMSQEPPFHPAWLNHTFFCPFLAVGPLEGSKLLVHYTVVLLDFCQLKGCFQYPYCRNDYFYNYIN